MPDTKAGVAATGTGDRSRPRAVLPALCLTQITSWGIVYYAFPVLNPAITADTGWSPGATTAAFSAALVVSAIAGIYVGRVLDHRGPRLVMTAGSVVGALSLLVIAAAPSLAVFFAGWLLAGAAMAAVFYQPAFAALTRWWAPDHVRALTIVTLAGGLASTVFAPLTAILADHMSWRACSGRPCGLTWSDSCSSVSSALAFGGCGGLTVSFGAATGSGVTRTRSASAIEPLPRWT